MNEYPYILEPYRGMNTRYRCPSCQHRDKTFSRYINTKTGEQVNPSVGRCNRESNCSYHYTPKQYFQDNSISFDTPQGKAYSKPKAVTLQPKPVTYIPVEVLKGSLQGYEANNFTKYLISLFGVEVASQLISQYFIATSKYQFRSSEYPDYVSETGANVFWQIDERGNIRTGKIMLYNPATGKRIKEPFNHIHWVHKAIKQPAFELRQCLFGEHLLQDKTKPVAIVESEKTAVIASVYLPQFIWLAVGSLASLNAEKCSALKGRSVTLFPDLNGFEKWSNKAKELSQIAPFTVSDLLERKATEAERKQGLDLADYLIKFDCREFALPQPEATPAEQREDFSPVVTRARMTALYSEPQPENWEQDITELETFFASVSLPTQPTKPNHYSTITNVPLFIASHLTTVKAQNGKPTFLPYLNRLQQLKTMLTNANIQKI